ncbi:uncharacterized protein CELE_C54F6.17 [Caenorhabditis elegans]|uniref:Hypotheticial protein n=1 Tax=Caenorhabditis elegans TaxID=6239 RepID=L8E959_CAEEL|nr:uncharacterized protein CELE_C54F6.17 [Caenorhabditis elegans]CCQ25692.1 Hypotheticial protein [Caenorhabditis elegans]|eukprot:NP_001263839.1 Uncharacterized protein CELE_C54F6.17 [Caenorhabditis elegans]
MSFETFFLFLVFLVAIKSEDLGSDAKENDIECVLSCEVDKVEDWEKCAEGCYSGKMDDSDRTFVSCGTNCINKFFKPNTDVADLQEFENCAEKCVEDYRDLNEK